MWKEYYHATGIYDFDYALNRLKMDPLINVNIDERYVDVPIKLSKDERCVVRVKAEGTIEKPVFSVMSDHDDEQDVIFEHVRNIFQWDKDLQEIYDFFQDTELSGLFFTYPGTPIVRDFDLYGSLMKTLIHQQLNMRFSYELTRRFVTTYGEEMDGSWFYPEPEVIAALEYDDLRKLQFSQRKAEYVIDTSKKIASGELDLKKISQMPNEELMKTLDAVRGIGPWTVQSWMLFGLGRDDLLPGADIGIQHALKRLWKMEMKPLKDEVEERALEWKPFRSYASITLWRSIE